MLPEITGAVAVTAVVKQIRTSLLAPYVLNGELVSVTISIGAATYRADGAMYLEKALRYRTTTAAERAREVVSTGGNLRTLARRASRANSSRRQSLAVPLTRGGQWDADGHAR